MADTAAPSLPTWDEALSTGGQPAAPKSLPTWDEALSAPPAAAPASDIHNTDPATNQFFSQTSAGRVMKAFGQGFTEGLGPDQVGLSDESAKWFKSAGIFNDHTKNQENILKSFNEGIIRPAAAGLDGLLRTGSGLIGGVSSALGQVGAEVPESQAFPFKAGSEIVSGMQTGFGLGAEFSLPHPVIADGVRSNVIGPGVDEATYQGLKPASPEQVTNQNSIATARAAALEAQRGLVNTETGLGIHDYARSIASDLFKEKDALETRQQVLRDSLHEPEESFGKEIDNRIAELEAQSSALNTLPTGLSDEELEATVKGNNAKGEQLDAEIRSLKSSRADSIEQAAADARTELQKNDYRLRDLAPEANAAYRQAQEQLGSEVVSNEAPHAEEAVSPVPETQPYTEATPEALKASIARDVSDNLVAAGRPTDEAQASAALIQAHYQAIAEQGWAKGTPEEIYDRDKADIRRSDSKKSRSPEMAQRTLGKIERASSDTRATITLMKDADASTFMHETGHQWLDEMMRYAKEGDAPESLLNSEKVVRDWLKNDGEEITRRQHEKFARGFERYLMEGVAPSRELAGVFANFKQWLTNIYQTVQRLRSPITDDIRDVFDRLLSANPEKTVLASDHEPGKYIANIHEEEAVSTPPEKAAAAADDIRAEINSTAKLHNPEIHDAIRAAESGESVSGGATPSGGDAATGAEGQPGTGGSGAPDESPALPASGDNAQAEGVATRKQPDTKSEEAKPGESSNASELLGKPESNLVDKAGNIRVDNLNTPEDVNEVLRQTASDNDNFLGARRGVISDNQALQLADSLGMRSKDLNLRKIGQAFNAEQILAARKLLVQSATELRDVMANAATGSDEDVMKYAEAKARHMMIQEQVSGVTAEAGRALRAFRALQGGEEAQAIGDFLKQATGKDLYQLRREAKLGAALDTPQKVSKFITDSKKPSFGDQILEYWINGLISGLATHITYIQGNTLSMVWKAVPETAAASLIGKAHEALGGEGGGVRIGEVGAQLKGAVEAIPTALSAAGKALKSGVSTLLPGEEAKALPLQAGAEAAIPGRIGNESVSWHQLGGDVFGAIRGLRDGIIGMGELSKSGALEDEPLLSLKRSPLGSIPDIGVKGVTVPAGSLVRIAGRAIAAIHSFFRVTNYAMEKSALAYRAAADEGLSGNDFSARVGDIITNPSEEIMQKARGSATEMTLMGKGGEFTQSLSRLTNTRVFGFPLLKFIDPFVHIGSNVIEQSLLQRTPLGLLSPEIRADLAGVNGPASRDFAQARMLVGTALGITMGGFAAQGMISGSGPSNSKEASAWRLLGGNQPHSVRIGDMWYDVHRLGPLGMLMSVSADLYGVAHAIGKEDAAKVTSMLVHAFAQNVLDESFMRGPSELMRALDDSDRYGAQYVRNMLSSFVPFSVGMSQAARAIDPYARETRTVMDAIKAKIPYESESLYPRRDIWGQPIANRDALGADGFSAIYETRINRDPVNQALLGLKIFPPQPERKIRNIPLTDTQYDDYCRVAGKLAKMRLDQTVPIQGFSQMPEPVQKEAINSIIESSREQARSYVMMKNPEIIRQATINKAKGIK